jgi:hypothetical protein
MAEIEQRATLLARIGILERHANTLVEAFESGAWNEDAQRVRDMLREARASLEGNGSPSPLEDVERTVDAASILLASIGRAR